MPGGMAHQESWDPKPFAPVEYRGPFGSIETNVPGVRINEHLKHTASIADKITICRSMTHGEAAHERGTHNMFTGYKPSPALLYPSFGGVVSHEFGPRQNLPPYVCIPERPQCLRRHGLLKFVVRPVQSGRRPRPSRFPVRDLQRPADVDDAASASAASCSRLSTTTSARSKSRTPWTRSIPTINARMR